MTPIARGEVLLNATVELQNDTRRLYGEHRIEGQSEAAAYPQLEPKWLRSATLAVKPPESAK